MMTRMANRVDRFNSLLALLRFPVQLPLLRLATPTLLLTVLEAILETRIVDVPAEWRADLDPESRFKVVQYLLRAIHQVTLGINSRTGLVPPSEAQVEHLEPRKIVDQDEQSLETVLEVLLWIAEALDIKSRPPPPSSQRPRTVRVLNSSPPPPNILETYSGDDPGQGKLFSRQLPIHQPPRPPRTALSDTSSPSKHRLAPHYERPPSTTTSEPGLLLQLERSASPPLRSAPPPTTPTRRDRLPNTTGFLAELARARSPAQASASSLTSIEGDAARSPPTSPRKSIVEVMRSLELRRTEKTAGGTTVVDRRPTLSTPRVEHQGPIRPRDAGSAAHLFTAGVEPRVKSRAGRSPTSPSYSSSSSSAPSSSGVRSFCPSASRKTARRRSRSKAADERAPNSGSRIDPLPPCTCTCTVVEETSAAAHSARPANHPREQSPSFPSASPVSPLPSTSAAPSRDLQGHFRSAPSASPSSPTPSTPTSKRSSPPHRIRVSRISPTTLSATASNNIPTSLESGLLSVHSSTDFDSDSPPGSRPPDPSGVSFTPPPPTHPTTISYGAGPTTDTPSPYTLLLLAHRDRLREKLRILERRERDRKAAAEAMMGAERKKVVPLPGGGPGMPAGIAV